MDIHVLKFACGNGKTLYTKETAGDTMHKIVRSVEHYEDGIRSMELVTMSKSRYESLDPSKIAVPAIGS